MTDFKGGKARWKQAGLPFESSEGEERHHEQSEEAAEEHDETCEFC